MKLHSYLIALFLLCFNLLQIKVTPYAPFDNVTDHQALVEFKNSVVNDPNGVLNSWNKSVHLCHWFGVACGTRHPDRVTALNLTGLNLRGRITPHIGNLSFLGFINLANNSFSGEIPRQVGRLRRLKYLNLYNNTLEGEIPVSLFNCSELRVINFMRNKLIGVIPPELGFLPKFEHLQVSVNNLTGGIPPSLGNISTLRFFSAGFNNLAGNIPAGVGGLKNLQFFAVPANKLYGIVPPSIFNLSSIELLSLGVNNLSGIFPSNFGINLPRLEDLEVGSNQLSGPIPVSLSNASRLHILDLALNNFVGQVPKSLGNLSKLRWLLLSRNHFGSNSSNDLDVLAYLANCTELQVLDLNSNNFGGNLPDFVGNLSNQLNYLYLGVNNIHGNIPGALEKLDNLICLSIHYNSFTGGIPEYIGKFVNMQILSFEANRFLGTIPISLGNLTQLFHLDLSQKPLEGSIPSTIGSAHNLQLLSFSQNKLSGELPTEIFSLPSLSLLLLDFSHNALSGNLPIEVGNLKTINLIDLSSNNLSGEIPITIGGCSSLESLFLQENSFDRNIPSSLASAKGLVNLDLSHNNLSGEIPKELSNLHFMLYLNLSFNDLEGELPNAEVFKNTSAVSVVGNPKLCGDVEKLKLPKCPSKEPKPGMSRSKKLTLIILPTVAGLFLLCSLFLVLYRRKMKSRMKKSSFAELEVGFLSKVSYQTLYRATDGFSPSALIGAGSFGTVYKGILEFQNEVAIKVLNLQQKGGFKSFITECNALKAIRHRNLVKILTCCSSLDHKGNDFKALVFEYMPNGSLDKWLHPVVDQEHELSSRGLSLIQRLDIAADVAFALSYLHENCEQAIIHCDLKPSNILLDNEMVAHVNDFGLARLISSATTFSNTQSSTTGIKGTIGYAAPEYATGGTPSTYGDVYSYGVLILEMFTGKRPTNEMFTDDLNLHNFVNVGLSERLDQIVDPTLLPREEEEINANIRKCLFSVLNVGLACSVQSPKERMKMEDVTGELQLIKNAYVGVGMYGHREGAN